MLDEIKVNKKIGSETFSFNSQEQPIDVLNFWQWSSSDLLGNALRGKLAEFIVASSIGQTGNLRVEWDEYDLLTDTGIKIEIKSSSYLQSWKQFELSKIIFGIQPKGETQSRNSERSRKSDIYIFCVLAHKDKNTVNPLQLEQWNFYILHTSVLDEEVPHQKTITLSSLLDLEPDYVKYDKLGKAINLAANKALQRTANHHR
jgi:hypothetical protein